MAGLSLPVALRHCVSNSGLISLCLESWINCSEFGHDESELNNLRELLLQFLLTINLSWSVPLLLPRNVLPVWLRGFQ